MKFVVAVSDKRVKNLTEETKMVLLRHPFPGNPSKPLILDGKLVFMLIYGRDLLFVYEHNTFGLVRRSRDIFGVTDLNICIMLCLMATMSNFCGYFEDLYGKLGETP